MNALLLDFDGPCPGDLLDRLRSLFRWCGGRPAVTEISKTAHGFHVRVQTRARWAADPLAVVAAQAVLGSDPKRETFNLMRALSLGARPAFWRQRHRWNTLYCRKIQG